MPDDTPQQGSLWLGLAIGVGLEFVAIAVLLMFRMIATVMFVGLAQVLWMPFAYGYFSSKNETESAKGVLIAAGLCFLLNAACFGVLAGLSGGKISGG